MKPQRVPIHTDPEAELLAVRQIKTVYEWKGVKVTHTQLDPGQAIPWHKHTEVADTFYAIRGPVTIETEGGGQDVVVSAGETARVAAGQAHRVSNHDAEMVEFLLIQGGGQYDVQGVDAVRITEGA